MGILLTFEASDFVCMQKALADSNIDEKNKGMIHDILQDIGESYG